MPWSCAHDRSGLHVLMAITWNRCAEIPPVVLELGVKHGLVCYDPQESKVYLPPHFKPKAGSRFRSWFNGIRMLIGGIGIIAVTALFGSAQELDPHGTAIIADGLSRAEGIVVGRFDRDWCLPWFDGWHCSGAIHVEETLRGEWKPTDALAFRWKERYGNSCLICEKVSRLHRRSGIWLLTKKGIVWEIGGTAATPCGDPLPMDSRDAVMLVLRQRAGG